MPDRGGTLYVVATPIGNLDDLTPRALAALRSAAAIYCEDTRVTAKLCARFGVTTPRISCHAHNEDRRALEVVARLSDGDDLALVTDAGTPAISDPGERIVSAAAAAGLRIVPLPGASAVAAALSVAGFPAVPHLFVGFPPSTAGARQRFFRDLASRSETIVYFEAARRLPGSLLAASESFGTRAAMVARELTKLNEEIARGSLSELAALFAARPRLLGECVVVVGPGIRAPRFEEGDWRSAAAAISARGKRRVPSRERSPDDSVSRRATSTRLSSKTAPGHGRTDTRMPRITAVPEAPE